MIKVAQKVNLGNYYVLVYYIVVEVCDNDCSLYWIYLADKKTIVFF